LDAAGSPEFPIDSGAVLRQLEGMSTVRTSAPSPQLAAAVYYYVYPIARAGPD
jgi:hypothetical protein